jgi:hypothetical protein
MTFQYSIRWQDMDPENAGSDGEYRDIELEDYLAQRERVTFDYYAATTTARDALPTALIEIGTVAHVGTSSGTGTAMPRIYTWDGAAWVFTGWWAAAGRPGVSLTDSAQTIATATTTDIAWGTEVLDFDGWTSGGSATLTVPTGWGGRYTVSYAAVWASGSLGTNPAVYGYIGGSIRYGASGLSPAGVHTLTYTRDFAAADTLKFAVVQASGGNVNVDSYLTVTWAGP